MLLPEFEYHQPATVAEAVDVLAEYGEAASVLAGGTDLLVNMKNKNMAPGHLVAIEGIEGFDEVIGADGTLTVGPLMSASALASSDLIAKSAGALGQGAAVLGSPQVRNLATVGGNVCNGRPAADMCVPLLVLGARAVLASADGEREVDLSDFFTGPGQTVRAPGELLTALMMDLPEEGSGWGYEKLGLRKALEISLVNVAASLTLDADGKTVKAAKVALGAVAPTPILAPSASEALVGQAAGEEAFAAAAKAAAGDAKPIDDHRGSADYRREMVEVLTRRALNQAWLQAQGQ